MLCGVFIIFLFGTIPYSLSSPNPLDKININLNLGQLNYGQTRDYQWNYNNGLYPSSNDYGPASDNAWYENSRYTKYASNKNRRKKHGTKASDNAWYDNSRYTKYASHKNRRNKHGTKAELRKNSQVQMAIDDFSPLGTHCKIPTPSINPESMAIQDGDMIYAGFAKPDSGPSGKIKFNICKRGSTNGQYDCSHLGFEVSMFGSENVNEPLGPPSQILIKRSVTENVKQAGITKIDDLRFTIASIKDLFGNKIEGEVAHPILIFRPRNGTHDLYTIFFNTSVIQHPAIKMTKQVKIKIDSINEEIFHVNNEDDYEKCNDEKFFCMAPNLYMDKEFIRGNGNNHNGSYYFFDRDGLPRNCLGHFAESSRGSKVQIKIDPSI